MPPAAPARVLTRALAGAVACALLAAPGVAQAADPLTAVLDRTNAEPVKVPAERMRAQQTLRRALGDAALLEIDPVTGTPQVLARLNGFLTPPSKRDEETIALTYVRDHADAFGLDAGDVSGLRLTSRKRAPDGTSYLSWEQRAGGLPNVDGSLHAAISEDGRLVNLRGGVVPDVNRDAPEPRVSAAAAYSAAVPGGTPPPPSTTKSDAARTTAFATGGSASLVRYQSDGASRIGWRLLVPAGSNALYDAIVDARTGALQRRINRVRFASQITHFDVNPRAEDGAPTVSDVPAHWLDGGTDLSGPYVHAVSDLDDSIRLAVEEPPFSLTQEPSAADAVQSPPGVEPQWLFKPALGLAAGFCEPLCSWRGSYRVANRQFSTAQLFWYLNTFRDHLARPPIGFSSASGGFEVTDPVLAQSLDGALTEDPSPASLPDEDHLNNASMVTLPDGFRGLMQVHLFAFGSRRYDGAHDASFVYHEYTHGLTDRLVTDAQGYASMFGAQSGALAEGISDFYALDFLAQSQPALVPDTAAPGEVHLGQWLQEDPETTGLDDTLRTEGVDCAVGDPGTGGTCPGTATSGPGGYDYGDFGRVFDGSETHSDGEIWAQTLWSIRSAIAPGRTPPELARVRRYLTDGLRLAPENPTFLNLRNAILQAAVIAGAGQDWTTLWKVFASRGMGWSASTNGSGDVTPTAAFDMPPASVSKPPSTPAPIATPTPARPSTPPPVAKLTALIGTKLTANRKGIFKVKVLFGDSAPLGSARLTVSRKRKRLARASTPVRRGRTVTKTLRLTKKGRAAIKRGRTKRVTLGLRLPGGTKYKKTVTLSRRAR